MSRPIRLELLKSHPSPPSYEIPTGKTEGEEQRMQETPGKRLKTKTALETAPCSGRRGHAKVKADLLGSGPRGWKGKRHRHRVCPRGKQTRPRPPGKGGGADVRRSTGAGRRETAPLHPLPRDPGRLLHLHQLAVPGNKVDGELLLSPHHAGRRCVAAAASANSHSPGPRQPQLRCPRPASPGSRLPCSPLPASAAKAAPVDWPR